MTTKSVLAGPEGCRRPCSQSCTVRLLTPKCWAKSSCDSPIFCRMARTSRVAGTCTPYWLVSAAPVAYARACRALASIRLPAFDIGSHPSSIGSDHMCENRAQLVLFCLGYIHLLPLGKDIEQEDRDILPRIEGDDPIAPALAFAASPKADLACATRPRHDLASAGVVGDIVHND